jgi:hypothetical protein
MALSTPAFAAVPVGGYFSYLAGYMIDTNGNTAPPNSVSLDFRVPVATCSSKSFVGFGVRDNGVNATVGETCVRGRHSKWIPVYSADINVNNVDTVLSTSVAPNDAITVSVSVTLSATSGTFTDHTTGFSETLSGAGGIAEFAVLGSVSVPNQSGAYRKVPMFPPVSFTNVLVNGSGLANYDGLQEAIQTKLGRIPPRGIIQVEPGNLGASSFQLNWVS